MNRETPNRTRLRTDPQQAAFLAAILETGRGCAEVRILKADLDRDDNIVRPKGKYRSTYAGYFTDPESIAEELARVRGVSVYVTANPISRDLLARSDRLDRQDHTASDADVVCLASVLIDIDPERAADISATEAERLAALECRDRILREHPQIAAAALWGCSGNGAFILVRLAELPNDAENRGLVQALLKYLAATYSGEYSGCKVKVDEATFNPARIMAVVGTLKAKGVSTPDRPHRLVTLDSPPGKARTSFDLAAFVTSHRIPNPEANGRGPHARPGKKVGTDGAGVSYPQPGVTVFDDFDRRADWNDACLLNGEWTEDKAGRYEEVRLTRPGKDDGTSATLGYKGKDIFHVFTSSVPLFQAGRSYTRFQLYTALHHGDDEARAAQALSELGYGTWIDRDGTERPNPPPADWKAAKDGPRGDFRHPADKGPDDDTEVVDYWPEIKPEAFHGIAGEIVELVDPHTESDPVAILIQFLVAVANLIGRLPYFLVSGTRHYLNLFVALVGATAVGRKGTSWDVVTWLLRVIDPEWADTRIQSGLVSGEGLIYHVRDESTTKQKGKPVVDPGVTDKRLLVVETELSRTLKAMGWDRCTLSDVLRQSWDHGNLRILSRNQPVTATGAHISIVGHATQADIRRLLTETDMANGFGNRLLWPAVRRSKVLPEGGELDRINWTPITRKLTAIVATIRAWPDPKMRRDATAGKVWAGIYEPLSAGKPGLLGAILSRAEAQVMRLACVFAMLDRSREVCGRHLIAAVALWDYCEASARFIFGDSLGDPDAEKLLDALRKAKDGLTRKQIYVDVFHGHKKSGDIVKLLSNLLTAGLIHRSNLPSTGGRPTEAWRAGRDPKTVRTNAH
jgi:hypothetical protein